MPKLAKRTRIINGEAPSTHIRFGGMRKLSHGFHAPQRPRVAKVQHPKPKRNV
jgi:hypothetical protein